jgi:REP element-mobilizing transposase RayT
MARNLRYDIPGSWHHVMNRGIARRAVFESRADFRMFMSCMARAVRRGDIEIHAFCLMNTHFHMLVRSLVVDSPTRCVGSRTGMSGGSIESGAAMVRSSAAGSDRS